MKPDPAEDRIHLHGSFSSVCSHFPSPSLCLRLCTPTPVSAFSGFALLLSVPPTKSRSVAPSALTQKNVEKKSPSWENPCPSLQPWDCLRLLLLYSSHTNFYLSLTLIPSRLLSNFSHPSFPWSLPPSPFLLPFYSPPSPFSTPTSKSPPSNFKPPTAELICSWLGDWSSGCQGNQVSCLGGKN